MNDGNKRLLEERVLVLAPSAADAALCQAFLADAGLACHVCADVRDLCRAYDEGAGVILLTEEMLAASESRCLMDLLRRQPDWSDVPILLLTCQAAGSPVAVEAAERLGNVTLLDRPVRLITLASALRSAVKARRRQYELRNRLEQLRASEERFRLAAAAVNGIIYEYDVLTGHVERTRGLYEVLGYNTDEVPPTADWWREQIHPDDWPIGQQRAEQIVSGRMPDIVYRIRHKDGRWLHVEDRAVLVRDDAGRPLKMVGCTVDVTARMRSEEALRASEAEYRTLFESAGVGNAEVDPGTGTFQRVNRRYCEITGYEAEELVGRLTPLDITHPDDRERHSAAIASLPAQPAQMVEIDERCIRKDGSVRWINVIATPIRDAAGRVSRLLGSVADITPRKHFVEQLRYQSDLTRSITDNATTAIFMTDNRSRCTFMNPAAEKMTGFTFEEIEGGILHDFIHHHYPDGRPYPMPECPIDRALPQHRDVIEHEDVFIRKNGQFFPVLVNARPIHKEGLAVGTVIEARDITEQKQAADAIREGDRRKDEFLATLAHELRNPLVPIRNAVELLRIQGPPDPQLQELRDMIQRQVDHMVHLVDELLDIGRISQGKIKLQRARVKVGDIIQNALETSGIRNEGGKHQITVSAPREPLVIEGDRVRLTQVVSNLLNNAAKYTPQGGHIFVTTAREERAAVIRVRDTGLGIPGDMLSKVFEMFTQIDRNLNRSQGGLGIGLALVKQLVETHGGTVEAFSAGEGQGAEFVVRLPLAAPDSRQISAEGKQAILSDVAPLRILVVDDNVDAANSLAMLLSSVGGHDVRAAHDGPTGIEQAASFKPDLILLDLGMPGMDGYETARKVRELPGGSEMVVVALTGWGQEEDRRRTEQAGFNHHLVKPVEAGNLMKLLSSLHAEPGSQPVNR